MRLLGSASLLLLGLLDLSEAWTSCLPRSIAMRTRNNGRCVAGSGRATAALRLSLSDEEIHEFDFLLHETAEASTPSPNRRIIQLGGSKQDGNAVVFTSAVAAQEEVAEQLDELGSEQSATTESGETVEGGEYDPYAELDYQHRQQQIGKLQQYQQQPTTMSDRFKEMDLQDIILTLIIPSMLSFAGLRWGFNKVANRISTKSNNLLDSFAEEMIYHDGNYEEMRMCIADYKKQLLFIGPKRGDAMIKRYLEAYAKKKTVSPEAIGTISYVFTLFKLSEERAAQVLVSLCEEMGPDKISSAGKMLFFGNRILKSPEGREGLIPIKNMIKSTYRDATVAETLVETSQQAIGEAAYRTTVQKGGKNQKTLTIGWEVLGLDKETATRIFEEEAKEGFISAREAMYGLQTQKYDKKGRRITEEGKLANPEEAEGDNDDDQEDEKGVTSNVYECSECGYTLFIAKGREFKFFGDDFECPECGAKKDKFQPSNIEEE